MGGVFETGSTLSVFPSNLHLYYMDEIVNFINLHLYNESMQG